jgi:hypothetical protein
MGTWEALPVATRISGEPDAAPATLDQLPLTVAGAAAQATALHGPDPKDMCQVLGPFRLMARGDVRFEILRDAPDKLVMLFENSSWGNLRNLRMNGQPLPVTPQLRPLWNGDSVAHWDGDTLAVDSAHFTSKTWLNENGVVNSKHLHLTETFRLVDGGRYLAYEATANDPDMLTASVSYTRYFVRSTRAIREYNCFDHKPASRPPSGEMP